MSESFSRYSQRCEKRAIPYCIFMAFIPNVYQEILIILYFILAQARDSPLIPREPLLFKDNVLDQGKSIRNFSIRLSSFFVKE